ncbi:MmgE/PrpD family protein [Nonomuraea sp. NPDC050478]|uniref:MmgE/PrpD family protein n=1 Tax=Nonomuraea sp. NPDC050478 TaxID=3364365 RepID=UPI0037910C07
MTVARTLVAWALGPGPAGAPEEVREAACRHLLDGFGTAVAGGRAGAAAPAIAVARGLGGPPESGIPGTGGRGSAVAAALATGTLVHALDFDDTHAGGLVHATAAVLPAALAVGEQTGASGAETLAAAIAGYETVCRLGAAAPHAFHARGLHATMACGVLAAAVVAARLMRLDPATAVDALGIAGSQAGGLLEFLSTGASTKQLHPGLASASGILAARLAAAGASGPDTVIEGPHGLYAALAARPADIARITGGLGETWETTRITVKPYPACQLMHATLDAAADALRAAALGDKTAQPRTTSHDGETRPPRPGEEARAGRPGDEARGDRPGVEARAARPGDEARGDRPGGETRAARLGEEVVEVIAYVHPDSASIVCEPADRKVAPRTPYDAKFSLPWSVAALLLDGEVTLGTYEPGRLRRHDVAALAARVRTEVTPFPGVAADAPGHVRLRLAGGREVEGRVPSSAGGPGNPLSEAALLAKFTANAGGPSPEADELARRIRALAAEPDLTAIAALADRLAAPEENA